MRLIGAGLPRTGTMTQKVALETLGLRCYHMQHLLENLTEVELWERARDGHTAWAEIFDGFEATVDWPAAYHWRELIDVYPDAKVLLSVRDGESFARSVLDTLWSVELGNSLMYHLSRARTFVDDDYRRFLDLAISTKWIGTAPFAGTFGQQERLVEMMECWNDEVVRTVPADRLLVWRPQDGWEPLCHFLAVPVPQGPFPSLNESHGFKQAAIARDMAALLAWWENEKQPQG